MKTDTVKLGSFSAHLWLASDGRWKWHTRRSGRRTLCAAVSLDKARAKAKAQLKAMRDGKTELDSLSPAVLADFLRWRGQQIASPTLANAVEEYLVFLHKRGVRETRIIDVDITNFAKAHRKPIAAITPAMLTDYLDGLGVGPRRWNNVRASISGLFRWARTMGKLPDTITAPEKVHARRVEDKPVGIYTPKQFAELLACTDDDFRLAVAVGGLAGLRSEEIHQLRWEDLKLDRDLIEVRAATVKTGKRRLVQILPVLAAWIAVSEPQEGKMVAPRLSFSVLQKRLKRHHGIKWIHNGLRHSYGTYRCAVLKDIAAVSYEMGNSPSMVKKHYLEMQDESAGRAWFEVTPDELVVKTATTK